VASPDYAEYITATDPSSVVAGDLVSLDPNNPGQVILSSTAYDPNLVGVISTHPGFITNATSSSVSGGASDPSQKPLALAGRVPVKVDGQNGPIEPGDYITSSSTPGYGMKATQQGKVIGIAMSGFSGTTASSTGQILVFINNTYYNPVGATSIQGSNPVIDSLEVNGAISGNSLTIAGLMSTATLSVSGNASVGGDLSVSGNLSIAGMTSVNNLTVNGQIVTSGSLPGVEAGPAIGSASTVTISGNDTAGTLTIIVNTQPSTEQVASGMTTQTLSSGDLVNVNFVNKYLDNPRVVITPDNAASVNLPIYVTKTDSGFDLNSTAPLVNNQTYQFDYIVIGSQANN